MFKASISFIVSHDSDLKIKKRHIPVKHSNSSCEHMVCARHCKVHANHYIIIYSLLILNLLSIIPI